MRKPTRLSAHEPSQNRILAALPALDYKRLLPHLELIALPVGWIMSESGDHVNFLHFPTTGIVSLIYELEDGSSSEFALGGQLQHLALLYTQELIATLLGVRRESVTSAIGKLQKDDILSSTRGHITVLDRSKQKARVCECYETVNAKYKRLLPHPRGSL